MTHKLLFTFLIVRIMLLVELVSVDVGNVIATHDFLFIYAVASPVAWLWRWWHHALVQLLLPVTALFDGLFVQGICYFLILVVQIMNVFIQVFLIFVFVFVQKLMNFVIIQVLIITQLKCFHELDHNIITQIRITKISVPTRALEIIHSIEF